VEARRAGAVSTLVGLLSSANATVKAKAAFALAQTGGVGAYMAILLLRLVYW
jgi:hypothetical protein